MFFWKGLGGAPLKRASTQDRQEAKAESAKATTAVTGQRTLPATRTLGYRKAFSSKSDAYSAQQARGTDIQGKVIESLIHIAKSGIRQQGR